MPCTEVLLLSPVFDILLNPQRKHGFPARGAADAEGALVQSHDLARETQTDPGPARFGSEEGDENSFCYLLWNALTVIDDLDHRVSVAVGLSRQFDVRLLLRTYRFEGVLAQVDQHLLYQDRVGGDLEGVGLDLGLERDGFLGELILHEAFHPFHQIADPDDLELRLGDSRQFPVFLDENDQAFAALFDGLCPRPSKRGTPTSRPCCCRILFYQQFLSERLDKMYEAEEKVGERFAVSSLLALLLSCLGLCGLTSFLCEQRTKEIAVRKAHGASSLGILRSMLIDYVKPVFSIGKMVTIGHGVIAHGKQIGDHAVIGMGAVISIWSEIGEWAIVAEGSVVKLKQIIPPKIVAAGNPAKIIHDISEKDEEFWNWGKKIYIDLAEKYLDIGMRPLDNR